MEEIYRAISQNGRWGISLVSEGFPEIKRRCPDPMQAGIWELGTVNGIKTFRIEPTDKMQWVYVSEDTEVLSGGYTPCRMNLQGGRTASLHILSRKALVKKYGYKRRSSEIVFFRDGVEVKMPASVLLALGLVPQGQVPRELPAPEEASLQDISDSTDMAV